VFDASHRQQSSFPFKQETYFFMDNERGSFVIGDSYIPFSQEQVLIIYLSINDTIKWPCLGRLHGTLNVVGIYYYSIYY